MKSRLNYLYLGTFAFASLLASSGQAITFDLVFPTGTPALVQGGFYDAATRWREKFIDPITIRLDVGVASLGGGILGQAGSASSSKSYTTVRNALLADQRSTADAQANSTLAAGATFSTQTNRFTDNPAGAGNLALFNANLTNLDVNTANQKALGIFTGSATAFDAQIRFNSNFTFDYDPRDGITAGQYDFVGIAAHEIGHALGFVSGVDYVDSSQAATNTSTQFAWANTLDLFRYSAVGVRHLGAGTANKYFSIDGGTTNTSVLFSNGVSFGDGRQASHWKDSLGLGIMDPTAGAGELLGISQNDLRALDVIGFDPVPEPASLTALALGALVMLRRKKSAK